MSKPPVPFKLVTSGNEILAFLTKTPTWATESVAGNVVTDGTVTCFHSETVSDGPLGVWVEREDQYRISDGTVTLGVPSARVGDDLSGEHVDAADLRKAAAALLNAADFLDSLRTLPKQ